MILECTKCHTVYEIHPEGELAAFMCLGTDYGRCSDCEGTLVPVSDYTVVNEGRS